MTATQAHTRTPLPRPAMPAARRLVRGPLLCKMCPKPCSAKRSVPKALMRGDVDRHHRHAYALCERCYKFARRCAMLDKDQPHRKDAKLGRRHDKCKTKWAALQSRLPENVSLCLPTPHRPSAVGRGSPAAATCSGACGAPAVPHGWDSGIDGGIDGASRALTVSV